MLENENKDIESSNQTQPLVPVPERVERTSLSEKFETLNIKEDEQVNFI